MHPKVGFVALFVVACGVLLMGGGAAALLMGFDIVLTERGSAMTIGGAVALSGGVIAVGIGLALRRLNQIAKALEGRAGKPPRAFASDRPVLPLPGEQDVSPPPIPPQIVAENSRRGANFNFPALAAGAAAGGLAGRALADRAEHSGHEQAGHEQAGQAPDGRDAWRLPALPPDIEPEPQEERAAHSEAARRWDEPGEASPQDMEEELSRALAETAAPANRRFEDGLSDLLGRSADPSPLEAARAEPDLADLLDATQRDDVPAASDYSPLDEEREVRSEYSPSVYTQASPLDASAGDASAFNHDRQLEEPSPADAPDLEVAASPPAEAELERIAVEDAPSSETVAPETPVLGTYTVGGRTYRMYADGSVEAKSEQGVERFASMDELRKHLSNE